MTINVFVYQAEREQFEQFIAENSPCAYHHDGAVMRVFTGSDIPLESVPESVSPRQIRQALNHSGLRSAVEAAVSAGDQDLKDWWEFATAFERNHHQVLAMAAGLGVTEPQLDDLFRTAASL